MLRWHWGQDAILNKSGNLFNISLVINAVSLMWIECIAAYDEQLEYLGLSQVLNLCSFSVLPGSVFQSSAMWLWFVPTGILDRTVSGIIIGNAVSGKGYALQIGVLFWVCLFFYFTSTRSTF